MPLRLVALTCLVLTAAAPAFGQSSESEDAAARYRAVNGAMDAHNTARNRAADWPGLILDLPDDGRRVMMTVVIAGPDYEKTLSAPTRSRGAPITMRVDDRATLGLRSISRQGQVDLVASLAIDGRVYTASRVGTPENESFGLDLGGGYRLTFTSAVRQIDPETLALWEEGDRIRQEAYAIPPSGEPGPPGRLPPLPPIFQSPLTNSVIRQAAP